MWARSKRWIIAVLLFLIVPLLQWSLQYGKGLAERALERVITQQTGQQVHVDIDYLQPHLFPPAIFVGGIRSEAPAPLEIKADSAWIFIHPSSLLDGTIVIQRMILNAPFLKLTEAVRLAKSMPKGAVQLRTLSIHEGTVIYEASELSLLLPHLNAKIVSQEKRHFTVDINGKTGTLGLNDVRHRLDRWKANLILSPDRIEIPSASLQLPPTPSGRAELSVKGQYEKASLHLRTRLSVPLAMLPLSVMPASMRPLAGEVQATGTITGPLTDPRAEGRFSVAHLRPSSLPTEQTLEMGTLSAAFTYQRKRGRVHDLSGSLFSGSVTGEIEGDMADRSYKLALQYQRLPVGRLQPYLFNVEADPRLTGILISGDVILSGKQGPPQRGSGHLLVQKEITNTTKNIAPGQKAMKWIRLLEGARVKWGWADNRLTLRGGAAQFSGGVSNFNGHWDRKTGLSLTLSAHGEIAPVANVQNIPLTGQGRLDGTLSGNLSSPHFSGRASLADGRLRDQPYQTVSSHIDYQNRHMTLKQGTAVIPSPQRRPTTAQWSGTVTFRKGLNFDINGHVTHANLHEVLRFFGKPLPLYAATTGTIRARGTPASFSITGPVTAEAGSLYGEPFDRGQLNLTVTRKHVMLDDVVLTRGRSRLKGNVTITYREGYQVFAQGMQAPLSDIAFLTSRLPKGMGIAGEATFTVSGKGGWRSPALSVQAAVKGLQWTYLSRVVDEGDGTIDAHWQNRRVTAVATFPRLSFDGKVDTPTPYPFSLRGHLAEVRVDPFFKTLKGIGDTDLSVTGSFEAEGNVAQAAKSDLLSRLTTVSGRIAGYPFRNDGAVVIRAKKGVVSIDQAAFHGDNTKLIVTGNLTPLSRWNLFVHGEADMALARLLSKKVTAGQGTATVDVRLSDQWAKPTVTGEVEIKNSSLGIAGFKRLLHIERFSAFFDNQQVMVETLDGRMGTGRVHVHGKADLTGLIPERAHFTIQLTDVQVEPFPKLPATIGGQLTFDGDPEKKVLAGDLAIRRAIYENRVNLKTLITRLRKREPIIKESPMFENLPIAETELNIRLTGDIGIKNNVARVSLESDLTIRGTFRRPLLVGRLTLQKGSFRFQNNDFKITRGAIEFLNSSAIEPVFDVQATTRVRSSTQRYDVQLALTGVLNRLDLGLTSIPPLNDDTDILALLAFGQTTSELAESRGGEAGSGTLALVASEFLEAPIQKLTRLDRIQISPHTTEDASVGARLTVEKRLLDDRMLVTYSVPTDASGAYIIRTLYDINEHLSLVGERDENGQIGGDVRFRLEFR